MNFIELGDVKELRRVNTFDIEGYSHDYCELYYKIFYKKRTSMIYNLRENKFINLSFTNFSIYQISEKLGVIFLFKLNNHMTKKESTTLYCFSLKDGKLQKEYSLISHFNQMKRFNVLQMKMLSNNIYVLVEDYDLKRKILIILDIVSEKSQSIKLNDEYDIDYSQNMLFVFNNNIYIPYHKKKMQILKRLSHYKTKEQGILQCVEHTLDRIKILDNTKNYDFFNDRDNIYLACILKEKHKYDILIYKYKTCILKMKIEKRKQEILNFHFTYNDKNQILFCVTYANVIKVYNLINETFYYINSYENNLKSASLMANHMILSNDFDESDIQANDMIRTVYKYYI